MISLLIFAPQAIASHGVTEEDRSPNAYPWEVRFPNDSVTYNDDGSASIDFLTGIGDEIPGGTECGVLFVDANGNLAQDATNFCWDDANDLLGVGTNTPVFQFHAHVDSADGQPRIMFSNSDTGATVNDGLQIGLNDDESALIRHKENAGIGIWTNNIQRIFLTAVGDLGWNTQVAGNLADIVTSSGTTTDSEFHMGEIIDEGGYLTSTSDNEFILSGGAEYVSGSWTARSTSASIISTVGGTVRIYTDDSLTDGNTFTPSERVRVDTSGNFVIGKTTASAKFHVDSGSTSTIALFEQDNGSFLFHTSFVSAIGGQLIQSRNAANSGNEPLFLVGNAVGIVEDSTLLLYADNGFLDINGDITMNGNDINNVGNITATRMYVVETSAASTDVAGQIQLWALDNTPNELYYTDDAGNDRQIAYAGGAFHDGFSDFVADEHIDWTNAVDNLFTTGTGTFDPIYLIERASATVDIAGRGQLWVLSNTPNELYFTNDAGTDQQIVYAGGAFHDGFSDFVSNEHIDHTSVTLTAGDGLSGGGDISTNRTFAVDSTVSRITGTPADNQIAIWTDSTTLEGDSGLIYDGIHLVNYETTNGAKPSVKVGASETEDAHFQAVFDTGAQTIDYILIKSDTASATANKGLFRFNVDGTDILDVDDGGINFSTSMGISINGTDIITDSAGTATLSNLDAIDATTETTLETALDHDDFTGFVSNEHIDHTSVTLTAGDGLSGGGDISANRSFAVDSTVARVTGTPADNQVGVWTDSTTLEGTSSLTFDSLLNAATGDETAFNISYTTNKATSGNDYGLLINQTDTASPGTSYLMDLQVGGTSAFRITNAGVARGKLSSSVYYLDYGFVSGVGGTRLYGRNATDTGSGNVHILGGFIGFSANGGSSLDWEIPGTGYLTSFGAGVITTTTGDLDIQTGAANGDINLTPHGTGNVSAGNYVFDADQTVGAGQDDYVLTYDNATGLVSLEAATSDTLWTRDSGNGNIYPTTTTDRVQIGSSNDPTSTLEVTGSLSLPWLSGQVMDYTALVTDFTINCDATSADVSIDLPALSGVAGRIYVIRKTDSSGNSCTIDPNSTETINGASTISMSSQYQSRMIQAGDSEWEILAGFG